MKKKSLILASLLIATASLASCGAKKGDTSSQTTSNNPSSTVVSSLTADEQEAQSALKKFILTQDKGTVTATFTCPSTVTKNEKTYTVKLVSDSKAAVISEKDGTYTVTIKQLEKDTLVTLTASVQVNEAVASKTITFTVPAAPQVEKLDNLAALIGLADGHDSSKNVITYGLKNDVTVIGFCSTSGVIVADTTSYFYIYDSNMAKEVKVGDNLKINSVDVYRYYGLPEGVNISYEKVSSGNAVPETATTATTIAELVTKLDAAATGYKVPAADFAKIYKAKAKVVVTTTANGTNVLLVDPTDNTKYLLGYYKFKDLDNLKPVDGLEVEVQFALYDVYRNKETEIGGTYGTVQNGSRFYYIGATPEVDSSGMTEEEKATMAFGELTGSFKLDKQMSIATEVDLPSSVDKKYGTPTITWSWGAEDDAEVFKVEGNKAKINPSVTKKEGTLTVSLTIGATTKTKSYKVTAEAHSLVAQDAIDTSKTYKFGVVNTNLTNEVLFLSASVKNGTFPATTKLVSEAADVKFEAVEGGYNIKVGEKYMNTELNSKNKVVFNFEDAATTVYSWNTEYKTFTYTLSDEAYYLGTYNTFATLSGSKMSYAATSFVGRLYAA